MKLENKIVGHNISLLRKLKDIKAHDMAKQLHMQESTFTKYERGETAITIAFVQMVAEILNTDPLYLLYALPIDFFEKKTNSPVVIEGNSTYHTSNEEHTTLMLKLMENIVAVNERMTSLFEKKG